MRQTSSSIAEDTTKKDDAAIDAEALNSFFVVVEPVVQNLDFTRIIKRPRGRREADAMLRKICSCLGLAPFIFHVVQSTGYR